MANGSEKPADDVNEVADQVDDELGFSMPEFKVPTEVNDAVNREEVMDLDSTQTLPQETLDRIKREYVDETTENKLIQKTNFGEEELVFDREELVRTRDMRAFSRAETLKHLKIDGWLKDQRFAPDILVRPPRVLTKKWQEGAGQARYATEHAVPVQEAPIAPTPLAVQSQQPVEDAVSIAQTQKMDDPRMGQLTGINRENETAQSGTPIATMDPDVMTSVRDLPTTPLAVAPRISQPEPELESDLEPVHIDMEEVELVDEPIKPVPPSKPPAQRPPPRPAQAEVSTDDELNGIVQELLEEKKQKTQPHHSTAEDDRRSGWCHTLFDEEYLRTLPRDLKRETAREVKFIKNSLGLKSGARVLDLACGFGRHAVELAQDGLEVAGLDLSIDLLQHALSQAKKRNLSIKFIHGDMRELNFSEIFDGCYCWQTSFGYFNDRTNVSVLEGVNRSLKMGGRFLLDTINRDHIVAQMPTRTWWEGIECVFLEEVEFDFSTSILQTKRSFIYDGAPPREYKSHIRLYSLHELKRILGYCGFRVIEVSGEIHHQGAYLGPASRRSIILAEKIAPIQK